MPVHPLLSLSLSLLQTQPIHLLYPLSIPFLSLPPSLPINFSYPPEDPWHLWSQPVIISSATTLQVLVELIYAQMKSVLKMGKILFIASCSYALPWQSALRVHQRLFYPRIINLMEVGLTSSSNIIYYVNARRCHLWAVRSALTCRTNTVNAFISWRVM